LAFGGGGDTSAAGGRICGKRGAGGATAVDRPVVAAWSRVAAAARPSAVEAGIVGPAAAWDSDVARAFSWVHSSRRVERAVSFFQSLSRRSIFFGKNLQQALFFILRNQVDIAPAILHWAPPIPDLCHAKKLVFAAESLL